MHTMRVYDSYEKRFAEARMGQSFSVPSTEEDRESIRARVKDMLAYDEKLLPSISEFEELSRMTFEKYDIVQLRYTTWNCFYSAATLFMPHGDKKVPLIFVFCGHGAKGRLSEGYIHMGRRLAEMGVAVMIPDNIGQGDRKKLGHDYVVGPFYCGLTLQGMILMESVALIRHMKEHPRIDAARLGACGNSGGGSLCLLLAALAPELTALSSSGYPAEFPHIFAKERRHCSCNLLPGSVHGPEMWEILSAFSPKPLFIEQGKYDHLFPEDLFYRTARKVGHVYRQLGAEENFRHHLANTKHPWESEDRYHIASFFAEVFGLGETSPENDEDQELIALSKEWHVDTSASISTDEAAQRLTGKTMPENTVLADISPPMYEGKRLKAEDIIPDIGRGDVMKILAQMECALLDRKSKP